MGRSQPVFSYLLACILFLVVSGVSWRQVESLSGMNARGAAFALINNKLSVCGGDSITTVASSSCFQSNTLVYAITVKPVFQIANSATTSIAPPFRVGYLGPYTIAPEGVPWGANITLVMSFTGSAYVSLNGAARQSLTSAVPFAIEPLIAGHVNYLRLMTSGGVYNFTIGAVGNFLNLRGNDVTVSVWAFLEQPSNINAQPIAVLGENMDAMGSYTSSLALQHDAVGNVVFGLNNCPTCRRVSTVPSSSDVGTWVHYMGVLTDSIQHGAGSGTVSLYRNGVYAFSPAVYSASMTFTSPGWTAMYLGGHPSDPRARFTGRIDEVRVYSAPLAATDALNAYAYGAYPAANLQLYLPFAEQAGQIVRDYSGQHRALLLPSLGGAGGIAQWERKPSLCLASSGMRVSNLSLTTGDFVPLTLVPAFQPGLFEYSVTLSGGVSSSVASVWLNATFNISMMLYSTGPDVTVSSESNTPDTNQLTTGVPRLIPLAYTRISSQAPTLITLISPNDALLYSITVRFSRQDPPSTCAPGFVDDGHLTFNAEIPLQSSPSSLVNLTSTYCFWALMSRAYLSATGQAAQGTVSLMRLGTSPTLSAPMIRFQLDTSGQLRVVISNGISFIRLVGTGSQSDPDALGWAHHCVSLNSSSLMTTTWRNGVQTMYKSGVLWTAVSPNDAIYIGQLGAKMDDVRGYASELTQAQVRAIFRGTPPFSSVLHFAYSMAERTPGMLWDSSSNLRHVTYTAANARTEIADTPLCNIAKTCVTNPGFAMLSGAGPVRMYNGDPTTRLVADKDFSSVMHGQGGREGGRRRRRA